MILPSVLVSSRITQGLFTFGNRFWCDNGLCCDFITVSELTVSERVGTPAWMIHDSELEKLQSANGSHPRDCDVFDTTTRLTKIHLPCTAR